MPPISFRPTPRGTLLVHDDRPLRPLRFPDDPDSPHLLVAGHLYPARAVIEHLLDHSFDEPTGSAGSAGSNLTPVPPPLAYRLLSEAAREVLALRCANREPPDARTADRCLTEITAAGIAILPPSSISTLIGAIQYARLEARARALGYLDDPVDTPTELSNSAAPATPDSRRVARAIARVTHGTDYHRIARADPEEFKRIQETVAPAVTRWPWSRMEPGDRVVIPADDATRAQNAVHAYASITKRKYRTMRHSATRDLIVYRLR